jgi:hypothetical protein
MCVECSADEYFFLLCTCCYAVRMILCVKIEIREEVNELQSFLFLRKDFCKEYS